MKYLKTELVIIIFLWINVIISFIYYPSLNFFLLLGIIGLVITSILYKFNRSWSLIVLLILLSLSVFNLVSFNISFEINFMGIINLVSLILLAILLIAKWDDLSQAYNEIYKTEKVDIEQSKKNKVQFYKNKFEKLPTEELKYKLNQNLINEAHQAINEILNSREGKNTVDNMV